MNMDVNEQQLIADTAVDRKAITERLEIRPARKTDQGPLAELMYSSGWDIYDYIHTRDGRNHSLDYIASEFKSGRGLCSWKLLTVAVLDGEVVGTGTFYNREAYQAMPLQSLIALIGYYGVGFFPRLRRAMDTTKLVKPPEPGELYLANFGVVPHLRGAGVGSKLLKHKIEEARRQDYRTVALDVANHNPKAEALYSRLGFAVTRSKAMQGRDGKEYSGKKMELFL
ncbi:MAG: GNAT family N-acetyltransferase [Ketobacteraceae bacterium]|nr:GNAT family N-acetyltransferase [Ketobacteraceae bacterium]